MAAKFSDAPEVREIAEGLIEDYHPHLALPDQDTWIVRNDLPVAPPPVVLIYLFRDDVPTSQGQEVWGTAKKITGRDWFLARKHLRHLGFPDPHPDPGAAFRIEMSRPVWDRLEEPERIALTDHELMHCRAVRGFAELESDRGHPITIPTLKLSTVAHDLEVFNAEESRYPGWRHNLRTFEDLVRRQGSPQRALDLDDPIDEQDAMDQDLIKRLILKAVQQVHGDAVAVQASGILGLGREPRALVDRETLRAVRDLCPGPNSGLTSVTIEAGGKSVELTAETRGRINERLAEGA